MKKFQQTIKNIGLGLAVIVGVIALVLGVAWIAHTFPMISLIVLGGTVLLFFSYAVGYLIRN